MRSSRWSALENLLLLARVFLSPRARDTWKTYFHRRDYVDLNPDAAHLWYPAIFHFLRLGNDQFRKPSARFDPRYYLARYPDAARSGINALLHFAAFGAPEGRLIPQNFSRHVPAVSTATFENLAPDQGSRGVILALSYVTAGGLEGLFRTLAQWLADSGWTPILITTATNPAGMPENPEFFDDPRCHFFPLQKLFASERERLAFLAWLIKRYDARLLVLGGSEATYHWLPAITTDRPGLSVVDHVLNNEDYSFNNRYYRECIDATVIQSAGVASQFQTQFGDLAGSTHLIPLGVPIRQQVPKGDSAKGLRIGYFGRLAREKGPDVFVEIARRLQRRHADVRFVIAGDGPEKERVRKQVREAGLQGVVEMPGFVEHVEERIRDTDVVVLPSRVDGMPRVLLEAQALGIPVVASSVGGVPEIVKDGATGFLCPPEAVEIFCDRLEQLIGDADLRRRLGCAARQFVEQRHSLEPMKARYLDLFETLEERKSSPAGGPRV